VVTIVVVLPSSGSRYLQHPMWDRLRSEAAQLGAALLLVVLARELEVRDTSGSDDTETVAPQ